MKLCCEPDYEFCKTCARNNTEPVVGQEWINPEIIDNDCADYIKFEPVEEEKERIMPLRKWK